MTVTFIFGNKICFYFIFSATINGRCPRPPSSLSASSFHLYLCKNCTEKRPELPRGLPEQKYRIQGWRWHRDSPAAEIEYCIARREGNEESIHLVHLFSLISVNLTLTSRQMLTSDSFRVLIVCLCMVTLEIIILKWRPSSSSLLYLSMKLRNICD